MPTNRLALQLTAAALIRLVINTSRRFIYPFAPALSRGMGVPVTAITSVIAAYQFTGIVSPFFGPLIDRKGYRFSMLAGLGLVMACLLSVGLFPYYAVFAGALILAGIGRSVFDPALQAYAGEQVPYQSRGRVIGLIELSWAGSALIGIPAVGLLVEQIGWRSPFLVLGGLCLGGFLILFSLLPAKVQEARRGTAIQELLAGWRQLLLAPQARGILLFAFLHSCANDILFVNYGIWMEASFISSVAILGATTIVIGLADLSGEAVTAALADRVGLERSILIFSLLLAGAFVLLPLLDGRVETALFGIFLIFFTFEVVIVTTISLCTEILPSARATMLSGYKAAAGLGRMTGALIGVPLFRLGNIGGISTVCLILTLIGSGIFAWVFLRNNGYNEAT